MTESESSAATAVTAKFYGAGQPLKRRNRFVGKALLSLFSKIDLVRYSYRPSVNFSKHSSKYSLSLLAF